MNRFQLLLLVVAVTFAGGALVVWGGILVLNLDRWASTAGGYLLIALISLLILIPIWNRYERNERKSG